MVPVNSLLEKERLRRFTREEMVEGISPPT
jgi:hypothetical protein